MKLSWKSGTVLAIGVIAIAFLMAVPTTVQAGAAKQFKIGVMGPMTGDQARWGLDLLHTVEIAAEELNAKGGLLGAKVVVVGEDDQHKDDEIYAECSE